jgi:hypothetical protein
MPLKGMDNIASLLATVFMKGARTSPKLISPGRAFSIGHKIIDKPEKAAA